ncbi:MAG: PKD domain-containing protein, partial [Bacteroidetes bacterium]|nr:PKD domain-containing protein [Bacteroidota bacterium]
MNQFLRNFFHADKLKRLFRTTSALTSVLLMLAGFVPQESFGEGSNELSVTTGLTQFYLCNDFLGGCNTGSGVRTNFAIFGCSEKDRLNFTIESPDELVYMGFKGDANSSGFNPRHIEFRIKNSVGTVVYTQQNLPTSGIGFISNIGQAQAGPNQVVGVGGYDGLEFAPGVAGTYYIEFDNLSNSTGNRVVGSFEMELIDITVFNPTTNLVETGRLYSKSWQFLETGNWDKNSSTFYIYSSDQIITSLEFDQLEGRAWLMFCNSTGCDATGNFNEDRKSVYQEQAYVPEYDIFLNLPDPDLFPPATTTGAIIDPQPVGYANCNDGSIDFVVNVDKEGNAEVSLDFDPPYVTTSVTQSVVVGPNTISWDGNDGMGNPVPNNVGIEFHVKYINGLTNLPLYDIEGNPNGFRIELVSPSGATPLVFWDDTNIPGGTTNFTGCNSTPPNNGCHPFNYGDQNTVNTWWYSASVSSDTVLIFEERSPELMVFEQVSPVEICSGSTGNIFSVVLEPNTEVYHWSYTGTGATITTPDPGEPRIISVNFALSATPGNIEVYGTNANCIDPGPTASLAITVVPSASADAGNDGATCESTGFQLTTATAADYSSVIWTATTAGADGTWSPNASSVNPTYTPGSADNARGFVVLSLTAFSNTPCSVVSTNDMTLTIDPAPLAYAGDDDQLCLGGSYSLSSATTNHSNSRLWTNNGGDGTFDDATALNPNYSPGPNELAAGIVTLTLTANPIAPCAVPVSDNIVLDIQPVPQADAGGVATICDIETYTPPATADFYQTVEWTHNGDGGFDDRFLVQPTYTPGPNDITNGTVTLTITASPIAPCALDEVSSMTLTIQQSVVASAGNGGVICENDTYPLNGTAQHQNLITWSNGTGDGTFDDANILNPIYTPGPGDIAAGSVQLTMVADAIAPCSAPSGSTITLTIQPLAFADAGTDATICEGETYTLPGIEANTQSVLWTGGDGSFSDATQIDPVYTPGPGDITAGSVVLTLTGSAIAPCTVPAVSTMTLTIQPPVTASAGPATALICEGFTYAIPGTAEHFDAITWSNNGGDGIFSDLAIADPVYTPGPNDIAAGSVTLSMTATAIAPCAVDVVSDVVLNIQLACFADAGQDFLSCEDVPFTITTADAGNYSSLIWTHNGAGTLTDANTLNPTYTPAAGEFNTIVTLTLSTTAIPPCPDQTDFMELNILEGSYADAGSDEDACVGIPYDFSNSTNVPQQFNGDVINWSKVDPTVDPTGFFVDPHAVVPVYVVGDYDPGATYPIVLELKMEVLSIIQCRESDNMILTIQDFQPGTVVTGNQTICYNIVPALMEVTAPTGGVGTYNYQWQQSTDNVVFTDVAGETGLTYLPVSPLTQTTYYKNVQSSDCGFKETPVITVNVWEEFLAGTPAADETICFGNQPVLLTAAAPTGGDGVYTYQWQQSTDNVNFTDITGEASLDYQPPLLTQTTYYRLRQNNSCGIVFTPVTTITVLDEFIAGAVSPDQVICFNTQPAQLSADAPTGGDGNYTYQWQNSSDNLTFNDITGATNLTYQPGLLTQTTYYQLNQTCACGTVTTATITVNVYPDFLVGSIGSDETICYNTVPQMITGTAPTGGDGTYTYQWQQSVNNVTFIDIPGATLLDYNPPALITTTYFRLQQISGSGCGTLTTNTVTITVYDEFLPGTASGDQTICFNTIPTIPLTAVAPTGADGTYSYQWEKSSGGAPYTAIAGATGLSYVEPNVLFITTGYRLMQTTGCGTVYTNIVTITVQDPPTVDAISSMTSACIDAPIDFFGYSTSNPVSWEWDFKDGTTFSGQNPPTHSYHFPGFYDVTLTVTDLIGCSNIDTATIHVVNPPVVDFNYEIDTCHKINFFDLTTPPQGYYLVAWEWEFGDGNTADDQNPRYEYLTGGLYNVTLTVTADSMGFLCTNSTTLPVIVPNTPTIYYTWDPEPTCFGDTTYFFGTAGTAITDWYWNFDDGTFGTGQDIAHVYTTPGSYEVALFITDTNLCENTLTHTVTINAIPEVTMTIDTTPTCAGSETYFTGTSPQNIASWHWDFGDGGMSTDQNPLHIYSNGGTYTVTLTATDAAGCSGLTTGSVHVIPTPTADYSYTTSGCNTFEFTDLSTPPPGYNLSAWAWDFGDNTTSDVPNPVHIFPAGGFYNVTLTVTADSVGYSCTDAITYTVQAPNAPTAYFTWA